MTPTPMAAPASIPDDTADWQTVRQLSHDLNNLVGAIRGYTEMLMEDAPQDSALAADLRHIHDAAGRAADDVATLFALARQRSGATMPPPSEPVA